MNFARLNTLYWTKELSNLNDDGTYINADLNETFTSNLLDQASDWVVAVERFEVSLNAIPYYDGEFNNENIEIYNQGDDPDVAAAQQTLALNTFKAYSLKDLLQKLNDIFGAAGLGQPSVAGAYQLAVDQEGIVAFTRTNHAAYQIKLPPKLNYILGLFDEPFGPVNGEQVWYSKEPRISVGDELDHIRISSNLNLISDTIGQAKTNIVTDLSVPANISASGNDFSWSPRDKLIYTAQERRYLIFNSSAPVQIIRLFVEYVQPDGTERMVQLPPGGVFNVKLGFYQRV